MASDAIAFNPYAAPKAQVDTELAHGSLLSFPRFSAWFVILLAIVTLGIYPIYWAYTRSKISNRVLPGRAVPMSLAVALVVLFVFCFVFNLLSAMDPRNGLFQLLELLLSIAQWIVTLVWVFTFRAALREISNGRAVSGPMTFFFGQIYLQYKINQFIDELHTGEIPLTDEPAAGPAALEQSVSA